jgi:predicted metal-dependent enzyme (double-stranded beta helix superfamily)
MNLNNLIISLNKHLKINSDLKHIITEVKKYNSNDWKKYVKINNDQYNKELVFKNDLFDIYIITWNHKQKSNIHNHPEYGCIYKVLYGNVTEYLFNPNNNYELMKTQKLNENDISYINDKIAYHSIENNNDDICVSLHIYKPPNFKATFSKQL